MNDKIAGVITLCGLYPIILIAEFLLFDKYIHGPWFGVALLFNIFILIGLNQIVLMIVNKYLKEEEEE